MPHAEQVTTAVIEGFLTRWQLDEVAAKQLKAVNALSPAVCLRVMRDYRPSELADYSNDFHAFIGHYAGMAHDSPHRPGLIERVKQEQKRAPEGRASWHPFCSEKGSL